MPKVAIIIVSYNSTNYLPKLFLSIKKQTYKNIEVILVDNNQDNFVKNLCVEYKIRYFPHKNLGYGMSCNFGAKKTNADVLIFLNPDLTLNPHFVTKIIEQIDNSTGLVSCFISNNLHQTTNTYGTVDLFFMPKKTNILHNILINGCSFAVTKKLFYFAGGFSPRFFLYGEDTDLAIKITKLGYKNKVIPLPLVTHIGQGSQPGNKVKPKYLLNASYTNYFLHGSYYYLPIYILLFLALSFYFYITKSVSKSEIFEIFSKTKLLIKDRNILIYSKSIYPYITYLPWFLL